MSSECLRHLSCCKSYDELTDIASTIQAYTSIHFSHEEWIRIRFFLMLYSCVVFLWTIIDSIFSDRTLFYFIYATHWILLLNIMLYLICSYVITLVIHERITAQCGFASKKSIQISKRQKKKHNENNHFEDIPLQQESNDNIPSLSQLGLFKWNKFIVFLQNASLSPAIIFPIIFWFVIFPNISNDHSWYDVLLEFNIHAIMPILILFDFIFSSRAAQYIDMYQPLIIGIIYCVWTYIIWTDNQQMSSFLYNKYFYYELNDYILWFILNLTALCFVHLTFAFVKSKVLSKHFMPIQLSTNHIVVIDKNGNIINSESKQYQNIQLIKDQKKKQKREKKIKKQKAKAKQKKNKKKNKKKHKVGVISELTEEENDMKKNNKVQNIQIKNISNLSLNLTDNTSAINTDVTDIESQLNLQSNDDFADFDNIDFFDENKKDVEMDSNMNANIINNASNSIKEGFKNLIAMVNDNKTDVKYIQTPNKDNISDDNSLHSDGSASTTSTSEASDDDDMITDDNDNSQYKMFYSLKGIGNQSDTITDTITDDDSGKFNAFKTRSLATLLNLSKRLHTISSLNKYNPSQTYKSEIEYSEQETSGLSDDEMKFGLKSGLYDKQ